MTRDFDFYVKGFTMYLCEAFLQAEDESTDKAFDPQTSANYRSGSEVFKEWSKSLKRSSFRHYPISDDQRFQSIEVGPGRIMLIGGAPGAGKTALTMQFVVDSLRATDTLRAAVCNVEMSPSVLLDRQLARLSGLDASHIRRRQVNAAYADRLDAALASIKSAREELGAVIERLCFVTPPYSIHNIASTADRFNANLILIDYVQRIRPPGQFDSRGAVNATMDYLRRFADLGAAIICVAAVSRAKSSNGTATYEPDSLNLASFRESSELEFGADDVFILSPHKENRSRVTLRCLKARHSEAQNIGLEFHRRSQRFTCVDDSMATGHELA